MILTVNKDYSLNTFNQIFIMVESFFFWGTDWVPRYYLLEIPPQKFSGYLNTDALT
jgi:hypothetical protein